MTRPEPAGFSRVESGRVRRCSNTLTGRVGSGRPTRSHRGRARVLDNFGGRERVGLEQVGGFCFCFVVSWYFGVGG